MRNYLIDTNVMLAASVLSALTELPVEDIMPREEEYREIVYRWLVSFSESDHHIVLDDKGLVRAEYERNLRYAYPQEYGMQVLQNKLDRGQCDYALIDTLEANGEHIAVLPPELEVIVTDREDRKWVACTLSIQERSDETPPIVYAAETDWFIIEQPLHNFGVTFERLLPDAWYNERI